MRGKLCWTLWLTYLLFMAVLFLSGCTRDRPLAETEPTLVVSGLPAPAEPQVRESAVAQPTATLTPEPPATVTAEGETIAYTVQAGDTISAIAEKFDTDSESIRQLNFLKDNNILVGEILRVRLGPNATAAGVPTPAPAPFVYAVQAGDTILSIALKFDVSATELVAINTLVDPDSLTVGEELKIPGYQVATTSADNTAATAVSGGSAGSSGSGPETVVHVVLPGQGLLEIARDYGVEMSAIVNANNIPNPNLIRPGQSLLIPGAKIPSLSTGERIHVVQSGQSLSAIALQYGVTMNAIIQANGIADANTIYVGQRLVIPEN